ncbi:acyltransferase [Planotetraspora silvatica]|uniref:Acyltransferase n=1 Tax=Planotetraspora silvatica TaxID=234614 RepID=A0A8J3UJ85_9ACTN|nr:acyltransferase [Planotetraspora silvatica]GII44742.1 acyltransferase [Planotetraspora silvatica]
MDRATGTREPAARESPNGPLEKRLPSLTGLRWFAAFAVFGFHLYHSPVRTTDTAFETGLRILFAPGSVGVPFFFILSGLVLTWSARAGDRPVAFWRRRAARIVPSHVATWIAVLVVLAAAGRASAPGPALSGLFLTQAWIPIEAYHFGGNAPAWSLSCELAFYAAFPLLLPLLRRIPGNRLWVLAAALVAGTWLVPLISLPMPGTVGLWFIWVFPGTQVLEFALGMTLALMIREGRWRGPGVPASSALLLAAYLTQPFVWDQWQRVAWMTGPLVLLIAAVASADAVGRRSWLKAPALIWLGEVSFAFYLVHQPVIRFGAHLLVGEHSPLPMLIAAAFAMLGVSLILAWLLHRLVERPLERRLGGRARTASAISGPPRA